MGSLWIGPLGKVGEVRQAATEFDRSVQLGIEEFAALSGGITTTRLATPPRRLTLSWSAMADTEAQWIEALARNVYGPGPLVVIDPASRNLLEGGQSQGYGPRSAYSPSTWGTFTERADHVMTLTDPREGDQLTYSHRHWFGFPVVPGLPVHMAAALPEAQCQLTFYTEDFEFRGSFGPASPLTAVPPAGAEIVLPRLVFKAWTGTKPIGPALLRMGDPLTPGELGALGDGCPAMTVTGYTDKARPPHHDLTLSLVEVRRTPS
ncbi:hypothetical protein UK23_10460 [Lentzea aerocolonigenes]|uniref:Uncharacterized protein n=1 Tax=Lentzea aerocolonigenes TaxID=68170 RepID=A0A0F0H9X8_LENAE|nr:hypothetical protein [Lentzea aerocolonigenes]KJK50418.1 hypothetical protein UK23_10460 [Lentzea aerocolonigenes]